MEFMELSINDLQQQSLKLARLIERQFQPDVIVFIAKGSFLIGYEMSHYFRVPLVECFAERQGETMKKWLQPLLTLLPLNIKLLLRKKEVSLNLHNKHVLRHVFIAKGLAHLTAANRILIVDDSVDTGHTARQVHDYLVNQFPHKTIHFGALNVFQKSKKIMPVHYNLYEDVVLIGPWSKDSQHYRSFKQQYENLKQLEGF